MQIQFHPASGRSGVRTISLHRGAERVLISAAALALLLALSLCVTIPAALNRVSRARGDERLSRESEELLGERARVEATAAALKERAIDCADLVSRIAFLYRIPADRWPRGLAPESGLLLGGSDKLAAGVEALLPLLERGRVALEERERSEPGLARRVPSRIPLAGQLFEPSAYFGPRVSPWTGHEEFFPGADIAAASGTPVVAPGAGLVVFAGVARRSSSEWLWRLGNIVVLSHAESGATVFGHLSRMAVRRGERVLRGQRVGAVGATGWAVTPQLHYEYWRPSAGSLRPTDPFFAVLGRRLGRKPLSLEQMEATSAPGPLDSLPGLGLISPGSSSRPGPLRRRR